MVERYQMISEDDTIKLLAQTKRSGKKTRTKKDRRPPLLEEWLLWKLIRLHHETAQKLANVSTIFSMVERWEVAVFVGSSLSDTDRNFSMINYSWTKINKRRNRRLPLLEEWLRWKLIRLHHETAQKLANVSTIFSMVECWEVAVFVGSSLSDTDQNFSMVNYSWTKIQ